MIKGSEGELMIISKNYLTALTDESAPEREITARDENGALLFRLQLRKVPPAMHRWLSGWEMIRRGVTDGSR